MSREWTEPHFGIQLLQGLPIGKAAIVEDYGDGFVVGTIRSFQDCVHFSECFETAQDAREFVQAKAEMNWPSPSSPNLDGVVYFRRIDEASK